MADNIKALKIKEGMNNNYVETLSVVNIDNIIKDLYIPDYIKEDLLEEGFLDEYDSGDYEVVIVECSYGEEVYVALNSFASGTGGYVYKDKDGTVWVSSQLPSADLREGRYYAGDEAIILGEGTSFDTDQSWLWDSLSEVHKYKTLSVSKETMAAVVEGL